MRLVEHTSKRWAEYVRTMSPIVESIVPIDSMRGKRWAAMSDDELVDYARRFVKWNLVRKRSRLTKIDGGLYRALVGRNLVDRVEFKADERAWSKYSDDGLVDYAQRVIDDNGIKNKMGFERTDLGLYRALYGRNLVDRVEFKADERAWRRYSDDELVAYAQKFVDENGIGGRSRLIEVDSGLYQVLRVRKLIDRVNFKADKRAWRRYSDDELVAYAQKFVDENGIGSRQGLERTDGGLYQTLLNRKLHDRVEFRADERAWTRYSDYELVAYAQKFFDENGIRSRNELAMADRGIYVALLRRKLIDRVFKIQERHIESQGLQEIAEGLEEFGGEA